MTTGESSGRKNRSEPVLYGIVRFQPGGEQRVQDTVITFRSAAAADTFAVERGWSDYQVTPLRFLVEDEPPEGGMWMVHGEKLQHLVARRAGRAR